MCKTIDRRGILDEEVFSYRIAKDGKVFISWHGRPVVTLGGAKAVAFIRDMGAKTGKEAQLVMAKASGNFKRGNEKDAKLKS